MMRRSGFGRIAVCLVFVAGAVFGQAPAAGPAFEVATIKPAPDLMTLAQQVVAGKAHIGMQVDGARVDIGGTSLAELIRAVYKLKPYQLSGPAWMSLMTAQRFDVMAKIPEGVSKDQVPEMLQALLAERFKLTVHRESRDRAVYALVVGTNGLKLKESLPDTDAPPAAGNVANDAASGGTTFNTGNGTMRVKTDGKGSATVSGGPMGNMRVSPGTDGSIHLEASKMTFAALADTLSPFVDRPVLDMTGLKGNYRIALDIPMAELQKMARVAGFGMPGAVPGGVGAGLPADAASDPSGGAIFQSVQKLGLKLESRKAPVEIIVVDRVEKDPTEN